MKASSVFHPFFSLSFSFLFSLNLVLLGAVPTARASTEGGRGDGQPGQCAALFQPAQSIVDTNGNPISSDHFDSKKSGFPLVAVSKAQRVLDQLAIAKTVPVFDPAEVQNMADRLPANDERRLYYEKMLGKGPMRIAMRPSNGHMLDQLKLITPNFSAVIDYYKKYLTLFAVADEPLVLPPVILLGKPGVGKTHFAYELAKLVSTSFLSVPMSSMTGGWVLTGADATWKGAKRGKVAEALIDGDFANPLILVDEIDKASNSESGNTLGPFYPLLEANTARTFQDEYLHVTLNASRVSWILTANYRNQIPEPILNRAEVFEIEKPTREQFEMVLANVMKTVFAEFPKLEKERLFHPEISPEVADYLYKAESIRNLGRLLKSAMGNALGAGRKKIEVSDIDFRGQEGESKRGIGFLDNQ